MSGPICWVWWRQISTWSKTANFTPKKYWFFYLQWWSVILTRDAFLVRKPKQNSVTNLWRNQVKGSNDHLLVLNALYILSLFSFCGNIKAGWQFDNVWASQLLLRWVSRNNPSINITWGCIVGTLEYWGFERSFSTLACWCKRAVANLNCEVWQQNTQQNQITSCFPFEIWTGENLLTTSSRR